MRGRLYALIVFGFLFCSNVLSPYTRIRDLRLCSVNLSSVKLRKSLADASSKVQLSEQNERSVKTLASTVSSQSMTDVPNFRPGPIPKYLATPTTYSRRPTHDKNVAPALNIVERWDRLRSLLGRRSENFGIVVGLHLNDCDSTFQKHNNFFQDVSVKKLKVEVEVINSGRNILEWAIANQIRSIDLLVLNSCEKQKTVKAIRVLKWDSPMIKSCLVKNLSWMSRAMIENGFCEVYDGQGTDGVWNLWVKDFEWKRLLCAWRHTRLSP